MANDTQHIHVCPDCTHSFTCHKVTCARMETLSCKECYEARRQGAAAFAEVRRKAKCGRKQTNRK